MARASIFHKVVAKEPSYTQLLSNLMSRSNEFRDLVLKLFLPMEKARGIGPEHIHTHKMVIAGCGIPDIRIGNDQVFAVIEVKTNLNRGITNNQGLHNEMVGYLKIIKDDRRSNKWYVHLIPKGWKEKAWLEKEQEAANERHTGSIAFRTVFWEQILESLRTSPPQDPIIEEFRLLLLEQFDPLSFDEKELKMLFSKDFPIRAVFTMENLSDEVCKKAQQAKYKVAGASGITGSQAKKRIDKDEYSFYVMRNDKEILYFGCYSAFLMEKGFPICFGVRDNALKSAFGQAVGDRVCTLGKLCTGVRFWRCLTGFDVELSRLSSEALARCL